MVSTTNADRTEKLEITLPISLLKKIDKSVAIFPEARTLEELLRVI
jgi:hypothetical protein